MKKILCIVLSAALIVLPVVMLIRKRHMAGINQFKEG